jgi:hypothetical protein
MSKRIPVVEDQEDHRRMIPSGLGVKVEGGLIGREAL